MALRKLPRDRRGIEGLPLQMMVAVAALALALPVTFSVFESVQRQNSMNRTEENVGRILIAAKQLALGGDGGVRMLELDLDIRGLEYIRVGGMEDGAHRVSAAFKMEWTGEVLRTSEPPIQMEWVEGGALFLNRGRANLRMSAESYTEDGQRHRVILFEVVG